LSKPQRKKKLQDFLRHCWFANDSEPAFEDIVANLSGFTKEYYEGYIGSKRWDNVDGNASTRERFSYYDTRLKHGDDNAIEVRCKSYLLIIIVDSDVFLFASGGRGRKPDQKAVPGDRCDLQAALRGP
jgi:hypothetical protein